MDRADATTDEAALAGSVLALRLAAAVGAGGLALSLAAGWTGDTERAGISWFGTQRDTVVPYTVGLLGMAALTARAAVMLPRQQRHRPTRWALAAVSLLLVGVVLTPYSVGPVVFAVHDTMGAGLFLVQLGWAAWAAAQVRSPVVSLLALGMLLAGLASMASLLDVVEVMLWGQIAFQGAFVLLAPLALARLHREEPAAVPAVAERADPPRPDGGTRP